MLSVPVLKEELFYAEQITNHIKSSAEQQAAGEMQSAATLVSHHAENKRNAELSLSIITLGCYGLIRCHNLMLSYSQNVETIMLIRCH